jgi:hypothetical protein
MPSGLKNGRRRGPPGGDIPRACAPEAQPWRAADATRKNTGTPSSINECLKAATTLTREADDFNRQRDIYLSPF